MAPFVSVVMPNFNTEPIYLRLAINSVLNQSFSDLELIIIDDYSENDSLKIITEFKDDRIKLLRNEKNLGVARTLNRGLNLSKGKYIARMDSDDICFSNRFAEQVRFLEENNNIDIVGSNVQYIGNRSGFSRFFTNSEEIRCMMLFQSPFNHPSVMFRSSTVNRYSLNYDSTLKAEDYDLWTRCSMIDEIKFANISKILLKYRIHSKQVSKVNSSTILNDVATIKKRLLFQIGYEIHENELNVFCNFLANDFNFSTSNVQRISNILLNVIELNKNRSFYDANVLEKVIFRKIQHLKMKSLLRGNDNYSGINQFINFFDIQKYKNYWFLRLLLKNIRQ